MISYADIGIVINALGQQGRLFTPLGTPTIALVHSAPVGWLGCLLSKFIWPSPLTNLNFPPLQPPGPHHALCCLFRRLGTTKAALRVYDPYYCEGAMMQQMTRLGYESVYNK